MMTKKVFALASVTGLAGFVTAITMSACSDPNDPRIVPVGDGGNTPDVVKVKEPPPDGETDQPPSSCKDAKASFTAPAINPPTTQSKTACTDAIIDALADACLQDPASTKDTKCKDARAVAANKSCVDCVFGSKADAIWKVINIDEGKAAQFNQAGCIDHVTGIGKCGAAYITILRCANTYCPQAPNGTCDDTSGSACFNEIKAAECKAYLLGNDVTDDDQACSNALQSKTKEVDANCFSAANTAAAEKTFFVNMVKTSCQSEPTSTSGDSG